MTFLILYRRGNVFCSRLLGYQQACALQHVLKFSRHFPAFSPAIFPESNPSVTRVEGNTKKIPSILRPSILRLFLGPLVKGRRFDQRYEKIYSCYVLQRFKGVEGPPFFFISSFYLDSSPSHTQSYILHNYVLNSDEGLTERALSFLRTILPALTDRALLNNSMLKV
jgi:hypothetical protein